MRMEITAVVGTWLFYGWTFHQTVHEQRARLGRQPTKRELERHQSSVEAHAAQQLHTPVANLVEVEAQPALPVRAARQGLRINVDVVLRRSVLTLKLWKC